MMLKSKRKNMNKANQEQKNLEVKIRTTTINKKTSDDSTKRPERSCLLSNLLLLNFKKHISHQNVYKMLKCIRQDQINL